MRSFLLGWLSFHIFKQEPAITAALSRREMVVAWARALNPAGAGES
jgi:hypothetical protein